MDAIGHYESGWNHEARGESGENGALQFMPNTWKLWSKDVAGRVLPMTPGNEHYVALMKVTGWIEKGYSDWQVTQMWNTGRPGPCIKGVNAKGVPYDSCKYGEAVLAYLR